MPQSMVATYLSRLPMEDIKAYTVELAGEPPFADIKDNPWRPLGTVAGEPPFAEPFKAGDEVITDGGYTAVFIGTDPKYPDHYVVRLTGFRADYVLVLRDGLQKA
jgi:hypothetical protein